MDIFKTEMEVDKSLWNKMYSGSISSIHRFLNLEDFEDNE